MPALLAVGDAFWWALRWFPASPACTLHCLHTYRSSVVCMWTPQVPEPACRSTRPRCCIALLILHTRLQPLVEDSPEAVHFNLPALMLSKLCYDLCSTSRCAPQVRPGHQAGLAARGRGVCEGHPGAGVLQPGLHAPVRRRAAAGGLAKTPETCWTEAQGSRGALGQACARVALCDAQFRNRACRRLAVLRMRCFHRARAVQAVERQPGRRLRQRRPKSQQEADPGLLPQEALDCLHLAVLRQGGRRGCMLRQESGILLT